MELDAKDASQSESMLNRLSACASEDVVGHPPPPPPTTPTPAREYWLSSNCWPWLLQKLLLLPIVGVVVLWRACWKYTPGVKDNTGLRLLSPCVDDEIDAAALMVCALLG
jgi:hypothetical protein